MGLGYFLAEIFKILKDKTVIHRNAYNLVELCFFVFAVSNVFLAPVPPVVAYISFMAVILLFALNKGAVSGFFEKPVFAKISKYCLSVFLTHYVICKHILKHLLARHGDWILSHSAVSIACVLLSIAVLGVFAHHAIEKPSTKVLKEWLG